MINQTPRDPWRAVWRAATSDYLIAALLLSVAAGLIIAAWLPQMPTDERSVAYAQWLSETQVRFGNATSAMQTLGLFTTTHSLGFRVLLALIAACLLLRLIENGDRLLQHRKIAEPEGKRRSLAGVHLPDAMNDLRRQRYRILSEPPLFQADRWPWANMFPLLIHSGGLLLLVGLLVTHLWGWQVNGLIIQNGERLTLPNTTKWVALNKDGDRTTHSPGLLTFIERTRFGIQAQATDNTGRSLSLQIPKTDPVTQLTVAVIEDQYFTIPETPLAVRLALRPDHDDDTEAPSPVLIQVYRSPPGRLIEEAIVEGNTELTIDDITLTFTSMPYAQLTVLSNPGLWPSGIGLILLTVGLIGNIVWPTRRFWLREMDEQVRVIGDLPPTLLRNEEH